MEDICKSTLEISIRKFVIQYGSEQLIDWLDQFEKFGGPDKIRQFKNLIKLSCEAFEITIADMHRQSKPACTDAKRVIAFIAFNKLKLQPQIIVKLLGDVSLRSINYYIKDVETWINQPGFNRSFVVAYNKVYQKLNLE